VWKGYRRKRPYAVLLRLLRYRVQPSVPEVPVRGTAVPGSSANDERSKEHTGRNKAHAESDPGYILRLDVAFVMAHGQVLPGISEDSHIHELNI
jgi:hypothetical protein